MTYTNSCRRNSSDRDIDSPDSTPTILTHLHLSSRTTPALLMESCHRKSVSYERNILLWAGLNFSSTRAAMLWQWKNPLAFQAHQTHAEPTQVASLEYLQALTDCIAQGRRDGSRLRLPARLSNSVGQENRCFCLLSSKRKRESSSKGERQLL